MCCLYELDWKQCSLDTDLEVILCSQYEALIYIACNLCRTCISCSRVAGNPVGSTKLASLISTDAIYRVVAAGCSSAKCSKYRSPLYSITSGWLSAVPVTSTFLMKTASLYNMTLCILADRHHTFLEPAVPVLSLEDSILHSQYDTGGGFISQWRNI